MPKLKGYVVLAVAVVMQACLGGVYAWSVFCGPLQALYHYQDWQTQLIFGTCMLTFTCSLLFTGRLQDRFGPRPLAVASGVLLGAGYAMSWLGGSNFTLLWLGSGLIFGLAVGAGYVCPIATAVKWFPRRRGLVAGLAVAGYGGAAIILTVVVEGLLAGGWHVLDIFGLIGGVYGTIVVLAGLLLFLPPAAEVGDGAKTQADSNQIAVSAFRRRDLLADGRFWWLFVAMFTASFPGLIFIGNLKNIAAFLGHAPVASLALVTMAVGNSAGRVLWGFVYDGLGGRRSALLSIGCNVLAGVAVLSAGGAGTGGQAFLAAAFFVGFCYGGSFGIYAPETARIYGAAVMGSVYPFVLVSHGITAVAGPPVVGWVHDLTRSYLPGLIGGALVALLGLVACAAWRPGLAERAKRDTVSGQ